MKPEYNLVLRTCNSDMTSFDGFKWPKKGAVKAPDWDPKPECGHGLHGLLHGCGNGNLLYNNPKAKWLIVKVLKGTCIDLGGKVKFPKGTVVYAGTKEEAVKIIAEAYPEAPVVFAARHSGDHGVSTSGDGGASTSGDYGESTSGNYGTSTSGDYGASTSGYYGKSASGDYGKSTSGDCGKSTSGYQGTSTSGNYGTSTSGILGKSTSGICGTSISGICGKSTSGNYGTSTSGDHGTSISGVGGTLIIKWCDGFRYRTAVAYVGENGIEPNVAYKLDDKGNFIKA